MTSYKKKKNINIYNFGCKSATHCQNHQNLTISKKNQVDTLSGI